MRIRRLIQKKTKKFVIKKLSNNFSTLFQAFNMSERIYSDIPYVNVKFKKNSSLAKKNETILLKIDGTILPKILETGNFDVFLVNFLKKNIKKKSIFVDIGSNHGLVSRQVSNINLIKKIICFEPVKEIFDLSVFNTKNIKNIERNNYGWAKKEGFKLFFENPSNSGDFSLIPNKQRSIQHKFKFANAKTELKKIISNNKKNFQIILKTDCQGYDVELFSNFDEEYLSKIYMYFLEIKDLGNNKKKFYRNLRLFDKIFVSFPSIHSNVKQINLNDFENYLDYKVEFDLILVNNIN
jgi:FkbM family methyltransferase